MFKVSKIKSNVDKFNINQFTFVKGNRIIPSLLDFTDVTFQTCPLGNQIIIKPCLFDWEIF